MNRREQKIHQAIAKYLNLAHPKLLWFHVPNGGSRNVVEAAILKSMGVLAGVSDIVCVLPGGLVGFMEIKPERAYLSPEQKLFAERAVNAGAAWALVRSIEDVQATLQKWLAPDAMQSPSELATSEEGSR